MAIGARDDRRRRRRRRRFDRVRSRRRGRRCSPAPARGRRHRDATARPRRREPAKAPPAGCRRASTISATVTSCALRSSGSESTIARLASVVSFHATSTLRRSSQVTVSGTTISGRPACITRSFGLASTKGSENASLCPPLTMMSAHRACCSRYRAGKSMALRHSTDFARFLVAPRNCASSSADALCQRRLSLVDQILRLLAGGEVERRTELRRRDPDDACVKSFGDLAGDFETRFVRLVQRQTDHDGRIAHPITPWPRDAGPS